MTAEEREQCRPQLMMRRPHLAELPPVELPNGYRVRSFQSGDEDAWLRIVRESFEWPLEDEDFERRMRSKDAWAPERLWFAVDGAEPVATASAWQLPQYGEQTGCLHMVGTRPDHARRGLGRAVVAAALQHMVTEGWRDAILFTDDWRLGAIRLYLDLLFMPVIVHENQRLRWEAILNQIGGDDWRTAYAAALSAPVYRTG